MSLLNAWPRKTLDYTSPNEVFFGASPLLDRPPLMRFGGEPASEKKALLLMIGQRPYSSATLTPQIFSADLGIVSGTSALIRATIFVRDLERSARFYAILGFDDVYFDGVLEDASACSLLGLTIIRPFSVRIIKRKGPNFGMIGLFELDAACGATMLPIHAGPVRIGEVALVFYVDDLKRVLSGLRAAGAVWSPEPEVFRMRHRQQYEVCLRDCDGILMNLVETDPEQQWRDQPEMFYAAAALDP